jgi:uncharacterized protein (DUF983 family)
MSGVAGAHRFIDLMTENQNTEGQPGLAKAALFGLCPACNARSLFQSNNILNVAFANRCRKCGLDYSNFNVGDGPAALLMIPVTAVVITLAIWLHMIIALPFWMQVIIWIPITSLITLASIRVVKAALLILEYRRNAGEAKRGDSE